MKRISIYLVVFLLIIIFAGCSYEQPADNPHNGDSSVAERNYPIDDNGCVDTEYAKKILEKKSENLELSEIEEGIIDFFFLESENGMAVVDMHGIGMQKVVLKIYSTMNSGETWQLVKDDLYLMSGYTDCIFLKDKLLFANYASVVEKTAMFFVDLSGTEGLEFLNNNEREVYNEFVKSFSSKKTRTVIFPFEAGDIVKVDYTPYKKESNWLVYSGYKDYFVATGPRKPGIYLEFDEHMKRVIVMEFYKRIISRYLQL